MNSKHCNQFFIPGKLTTIMDIGAGSSGKGKIGSYVMENQDVATFAICTFHPQAGHWVVLDDGRKFFYQTLNSCAYLLGDKSRAGLKTALALQPNGATSKATVDAEARRIENTMTTVGNVTSLEKLYIAPGAMIELPALLREIEENGILPHQLGISPVVPILDTEIDGGFEQGRRPFDCEPLVNNNGPVSGTRHDGTAKFGSTGHGVGSCNARRVLRRSSLLLARDVPELQKYLCDVPAEVMARLNNGESGLLEIAQGFQLSMMLPEFYPYTTSRNVTVSQGLADCMLPPCYAGPVIGNVRTLPIRISSRKYLALDDGRHLTWADVQAGVPHEVYEGNSGPGWSDQRELTWEEVTESSGSPEPLMELTSVTKLPRRIFSFSYENIRRWLEHNNTGLGMYVSVNFCNYLDYELTGRRAITRPGSMLLTEGRFGDWLHNNLREDGVLVRFLGTGAKSNDMIFVE